MDLWTIDSENQKLDLIEDYVSFIWTDRYVGYGNFELVTEATAEYAEKIVRGTHFAIDQSRHIMLCEDIEKVRGNDGVQRLKFTGRSFESVFTRRFLLPNYENSQWSYTNNLGTMLGEMVLNYAVTPLWYNPLDSIANLRVDFSYVGPEITVVSPASELYAKMVEVANTEEVGFRVWRQLDGSPDFVFEAYKGVEKPDVIFGEEFDTLTNTRFLRSNSDWKNVAYVFTEKDDQYLEVLAPGTRPGVSGWDRRILALYTTDIADDHSNRTAALRERGREELAKYRQLTQYDGEVVPGAYTYGVHYRLGDVVWFKEPTGYEEKVRVTEYIWASDAQGDRAYPTFTTTESG